MRHDYLQYLLQDIWNIQKIHDRIQAMTQAQNEYSYPSTISVALNRPLRRQFSYLPLNNNPLPDIGSRVAVPFRNQTLIGIVTKHHSNQTPPYALKPVKDIIDSKPLLDTHILSLASWLSQYYQQPLGEVLNYCLPTSLRKGEPLLDLQEKHIKITELGMTKKNSIPKRATQQHKIIESLLISSTPYSSINSKAALKVLEKKGFVESVYLSPNKKHARNILKQEHLKANPEQETAIQAISRQTDFTTFLVDGITGSGKTEVYLQAIEPRIAQQKQVLILAPEIGLVPQLAQRVQQRFNCIVCCLHSQLTPKQKLTAWQHAASGYADIIIGTRSALFAVIPNLDLIIIDEEHDLSFKQQDGMRFHARDTAIRYAKQRNIPIVLGSATPSIETLHNAKENRFTHLILSNKANASAESKVELLPLDGGNLFHGLHPNAVLVAKQLLKEDKQVLFFLNRRGYAPVIMCQSCSWIAECSNCDAKLTYHKRSHSLTCHHCGSKQTLTQNCPSCFEEQLTPVGEGTEQIEEALEKALGDWPIIRVDSDVIHSSTGFQEKLKPIIDGKPCILLGTQMLTKGHHFPNLALVIVINADGGLYSANYRAQEQLLQQLIQVSGRTGRESEGKVIIQTQFTDHPVFTALINQEYHEYAFNLIEERKNSGLPPFQYTAIIRAEHKSSYNAEAFCQQISHTANLWIESQSMQTAVLGPAPVLMTRLKNEFRFQLLFISPSRSELNTLLRSLCHYIEDLKMPISRWHIDVDPLEFI